MAVMTGTKDATPVEPIPDAYLSGPTPSVESDDELAVRRRGLMKAQAAESRAIMAVDLVAQTHHASTTGRDDDAVDEALPIPEEVAAQVYLQTALRASADLARACETRQDEMHAAGASEAEVSDALVSMARAHNGLSAPQSVAVESFDAAMTQWERGEDPGRESSGV
jgi:hypothetical protein